MKFKNIKKKTKKEKSPSNSRSIPASHASQVLRGFAGRTEYFKFSFPKINHVTVFKIYRKVLKVFVVCIFIITLVIVGLDFKNNLQTKEKIDQQRQALTKNLNYWENFISKHKNYRDAYFQASILEYKLGDISKAKIYVEKGLSLDPNSENGKIIEQLLR
jgi:hypothetical protein